MSVSSAPRMPLLPLDEALARLLAQANPLQQTESVATLDADGRVLAHDVVSALHVPPQDNSAMDGYAVHTADVLTMGTALAAVGVLPFALPVLAAGGIGTMVAAGSRGVKRALGKG